jgi:hypothetical protein
MVYGQFSIKTSTPIFTALIKDYSRIKCVIFRVSKGVKNEEENE